MLLPCVVMAALALRVAFTCISIDPDVINPLLMYDGVRQHGLAFVRSWSFTKDSWLLSLYPLHFAAFTLTDANATTVLVVGWLVFLINALLACWFARQWLGNHAATPWLLVFFLCANPLALTSEGSLIHPVSHSITVLWGLAAANLLLAALKARVTRSFYSGLAGCVIALYIGCISDPWGVAAFVLPMLCATAITCWLSRGSELARRHLLSAAAMAFVYLAINTRSFGLTRFLPRMQFSVGHLAQQLDNAKHLGLALGRLFQPVPLALFQARAQWLIVIATCLLLAVLLAHACYRWCRSRPQLDPVTCWAFLFAIFGMGAPMAAYLLGDIETGEGSGRFFMTTFYLAPVLLLWWPSASRRTAWVVRGGTLFLLAVAASGAWQSATLADPRWMPSHTYPDSVIEFLQQHDLHYGYGPYWGSSAEVVTALSEGGITLLPVDFSVDGRISPRRWQTSTFWYDQPLPVVSNQVFFVIVMNDGETCPQLARCIDGLIGQLGEPDQRLPFPASGTVLVWRHRPLPNWQDQAERR